MRSSSPRSMASPTRTAPAHADPHHLGTLLEATAARPAGQQRRARWTTRPAPKSPPPSTATRCPGRKRSMPCRRPASWRPAAAPVRLYALRHAQLEQPLVPRRWRPVGRRTGGSGGRNAAERRPRCIRQRAGNEQTQEPETIHAADGHALAARFYAPGAAYPAPRRRADRAGDGRQRIYRRFRQLAGAARLRGGDHLRLSRHGSFAPWQPARIRGRHLRLGEARLRSRCRRADRSASRTVPLYWIGHSLGGQILAFFPQHARLARRSRSAPVAVTGCKTPGRCDSTSGGCGISWCRWCCRCSAISPAQTEEVGDLPRGVMAPVAALVPIATTPSVSRGTGAPAVRGRDGTDRLVSFTDDEFMSAKNTESLHGFCHRRPTHDETHRPRDVGAKGSDTSVSSGIASPKVCGQAPAAGTELIRTGAPCPAFRTDIFRPRPSLAVPRPSRTQSAAEAWRRQDQRRVAGSPLPEGSARQGGSVVAVRGVPPKQRRGHLSGTDGAPRWRSFPADGDARRRTLLGSEAGTAKPPARTTAAATVREPLLPCARGLPEMQHSESSNISTRDMTTSRKHGVIQR